MEERYLGDGLYARFDGFSFWLRAPRENGDHYVALEPHVLAEFQRFIADCIKWRRQPEVENVE